MHSGTSLKNHCLSQWGKINMYKAVSLYMRPKIWTYCACRCPSTQGWVFSVRNLFLPDKMEETGQNLFCPVSSVQNCPKLTKTGRNNGQSGQNGHFTQLVNLISTDQGISTKLLLMLLKYPKMGYLGFAEMPSSNYYNCIYFEMKISLSWSLFSWNLEQYWKMKYTTNLFFLSLNAVF